MSDLKLQTNKDNFLVSKSSSVPASSNASPFSRSNSLTDKSNLLSDQVRLNSKLSADTGNPFQNQPKALRSNDNFLSREVLASKPEISPEKKVPSKNVPVTHSASKKILDNKESVLATLDPETGSLIKKFDDTPYAPYQKKYACDLNQAVITNTSAIQDFECSALYEETPFMLSKQLYSNDKLKSDPELKAKITNFTNLLSASDKSALAYTINILDRTPPVSSENLKIIFDKLGEMLKTSYDPRIGDNKAFVVSTLHDIAMPSDISQEGIGTCTGTSIQIQLAIRNPVEYLKMIDTLAKNQPYTTIKGDTIPPNFTFTQEGVDNKLNTGRTISAKIMQNSIMDFGDAETRNFDSSKGDGGLTYDQTVKALNSIVDAKVETSYLWTYTPPQLINILHNSKPSWNNPVEISLAYDSKGRDAIHSVNVIKASDNQITIVNPWGREETFPEEELKKRILSVSNPVGTEKNVAMVDINSSQLRKNIADNNTKNETLNKMTTDQKIEIIQKSVYEWDGQKFNIRPSVSEQDKIAITNILDELLKGGPAQNEIWLPSLKFFAKDMNEFLNKIQNDSPAFTQVKNTLSGSPQN